MVFTLRMIGLKPMCASTSRSRSMPGAISVSSSPSVVRWNTARSVTKSTFCSRWAASSPLKVICSTFSMNLRERPSLTMVSWPSATFTSRPPAVKVPQNTRFLVDRVMFTKPPQPTGRPLNLLTFTLPWLSACARPRKLASSPPPS
ncbi:hypothetical protein D3C72_1843360 [compost metagenome]